MNKEKISVQNVFVKKYLTTVQVHRLLQNIQNINIQISLWQWNEEIYNTQHCVTVKRSPFSPGKGDGHITKLCKHTIDLHYFSLCSPYTSHITYRQGSHYAWEKFVFSFRASFFFYLNTILSSQLASTLTIQLRLWQWNEEIYNTQQRVTMKGIIFSPGKDEGHITKLCKHTIDLHFFALCSPYTSHITYRQGSHYAWEKFVFSFRASFFFYLNTILSSRLASTLTIQLCIIVHHMYKLC